MCKRKRKTSGDYRSGRSQVLREQEWREFITRIAENNPSSITPIALSIPAKSKPTSPRGWQADEKFLQYDRLLEQRQRAKRIGTTGSR
jgi:hypothetical protein